jgi:hypothetical protein
VGAAQPGKKQKEGKIGTKRGSELFRKAEKSDSLFFIA